jgi:hypothetical protein
MNATATASSAVPRRRPRDWVVDTLLFLFAVLVWLVTAGARLEASTEVEPAWLFDLDQLAGALGCLGLWLRRRWPVGLALALVALSTFSETVAGAMVVALFTVAIHRPPRTTARVYALSVLAALVYVVVRPEPGTPPVLLFLFGVVVQGAVVGWGLFIHFRRQLVLSLRDRGPGRDRGPAAGRAGPSSAPETRSPARCTTCSATGCRCCACMPAPWSSAPTPRPRRSPVLPR